MKSFLCTLALFGLVGCTDLTEGKPAGHATMSGDAQAQNPQAQNGHAAATAPGTSERDGIIGKTTARIVDFQRAKQENPNLVEIVNRAQGSDPLSFAASAYISASSRISADTFTYNLKIMKAETGKNPNFEEFEKLRQQSGIRLTELPPYQMYAYDEQRGQIVVLEDPVDKADRYKRAGLSPEGT